jgi:glycosyltransferase involved in cell wall biosynthesis
MPNVLLNVLFAVLLVPIVESKPRVSIITSVYNGDQFIESFMADITHQTIFGQCEFILINANSPGNEEKVIKKYMQRYPNIVYVQLDEDPGIYAVWNLAIKLASADFITNANLDDRRNPDIMRIHAEALENDESVDLVYSNYYLCDFPNEPFETEKEKQLVNMHEFLPTRMNWCLPDRAPMWRKSMHEKYGYFDETFFSAGDWEFWNRAVCQGSRFKKVDALAGVFYWNPEGISTNKKDSLKVKRNKEEGQRVIQMYQKYWVYEN